MRVICEKIKTCQENKVHTCYNAYLPTLQNKNYESRDANTSKWISVILIHLDSILYFGIFICMYCTKHMVYHQLPQYEVVFTNEVVFTAVFLGAISFENAAHSLRFVCKLQGSGKLRCLFKSINIHLPRSIIFSSGFHTLSCGVQEECWTCTAPHPTPPAPHPTRLPT